MSVNQSAFAAILLLFAIVFANAGTQADERIFRCVQADGSFSFQRTQCPRQGESIVVGSVQGGWVSLRSGEKALLKTYRARDAKLKRRARKAARKSKSKSKSVETPACWSKRKRLAAIKAKLRRGYKASQSEGLRRQRRDYTEYLAKFCPK